MDFKRSPSAVNALRRCPWRACLLCLFLILFASGTMATPSAPSMTTPAWRAITAPGYSLHAVWGQSERSVFAVGESGTIQHFDGQSW